MHQTSWWNMAVVASCFSPAETGKLVSDQEKNKTGCKKTWDWEFSFPQDNNPQQEQQCNDLN